MGKYGNQQRWGQKDSAKEGGSKTDNAHGAPTKKTERLRGADATSGGSDATTLSKMTPMQGLLAWGRDNRLTDANGSSVGGVVQWCNAFGRQLAKVPELEEFEKVFTTCTPFNELPERENLLRIVIDAMSIRTLQVEHENVDVGATTMVDQLNMMKTIREETFEVMERS